MLDVAVGSLVTPFFALERGKEVRAHIQTPAGQDFPKLQAAQGQTGETEQTRAEKRAVVDELARYFADPELRRHFLEKVTGGPALEPGG